MYAKRFRVDAMRLNWDVHTNQTHSPIRKHFPRRARHFHIESIYNGNACALWLWCGAGEMGLGSKHLWVMSRYRVDYYSLCSATLIGACLCVSCVRLSEMWERRRCNMLKIYCIVWTRGGCWWWIDLVVCEILKWSHALAGGLSRSVVNIYIYKGGQ